MKNRNLDHKDNWKTPRYIIDELEDEFKVFLFDPCPLNNNKNKWDGLEEDWEDYNFVNPPYSKKLKEAFVKKAVEQMKLGRTSILLLPVSTSTKLFHEVILPNKTEIRFLKGRIKFEGINTKGEFVNNKCGMHDSMIVIFKGI